MDAAERTFQRPAAGPYQNSEVLLGIIDAFPQRIHLLYEPVPLVLELSQLRYYFVGALFNAEVIYGLADHYQDSEERDRGAQHYLAGKGIVDKCTVMLVNVLVDLLVGDKNQYSPEFSGQGRYSLEL